MKTRNLARLILIFALLAMLCLGAAATASAANTDGVTFIAVPDKAEVDASAGDVSFTVALSMSAEHLIDSAEYTVQSDIPGAVTTQGSGIAGGESFYNEGRFSWMAGEDISTSSLGTFVVTVPEGTPAGTYTVSFNYIMLSAGLEYWEQNGQVSVSITVAGAAQTVQAVVLDRTEAGVKVGETIILEAAIQPDGVQAEINWSSSDPSVASVDKGAVTGVKEGEAVITAAAGEKSASCSITVKAAGKTEDSEELKYYKQKALDSLSRQYGKYVSSDYSAADWQKLVQTYEQGIAEINEAKAASGAYIENNVTAVLNRTLTAMQAIKPVRTRNITVVVSVDASTLGLGYLVEPTMVTVPNNTRMSTVVTQLISQMAAEKYGITSGGVSSKGTSEPAQAYPWIITGSVDSGFYLSQVYWPLQQDIRIPAYIMNRLSSADILYSDRDGNYLGEFDYTNTSGWMYSVSDGYSDPIFPGVGASEYAMSDGEVVRWQFTVMGYGADLGSNDSKWGMGSIVAVGDKTALTWKVAELRYKYTDEELKKNSVYNTALDALTDPQASQYTLDQALVKLNAEKFGKDSQKETDIRFDDVPDGVWFSEAVKWAVSNGVTDGVAPNLFSPDSTCTRAQLVSFLWKYAGRPVPSARNPFTDVAAGSWYYDAVLWALENGITTGVTSTSFEPDSPCTRAQVVSFLWRFCGSPAQIGYCPFTDVEVGSWYYNAVIWAVARGVTTGVSPTSFAPAEQCTRAQIVTFMYRAPTR
ncbi:MAG: S-layer homology domain-containing protein [Oscillospiraceae bacterium]|nr:S-layer homology domain-containing protein [Oscillospiraceae bacterium]